jgi:acetyl esterase/lipase
MKKIIIFSLLWLCVGIGFCVSAKEKVKSPFDVTLWQDGLPNTNGAGDSVYNNNKESAALPFMRVFLPDKAKATGRAVIALPGGGYAHLAAGHEGYDWASFFNERGIALFVLNYRMPHAHAEVPASDFYEAIRLVRAHASEWGVNPDEVGVMGSSAGGHLATTVATHAVEAVRPDFQILFYPVVTMDAAFTHGGSRSNLIGKEPTEGMVSKYSNEKQVDSSTPPAIILCSNDDKAVPTPNAVQYYLALRANNVPASLYIYPSGGHGWGARTTFKFHDAMQKNLSDWLEQLTLGSH